MMRSLLSAFSRLADVFFPRVCAVCGTSLVDGEQVMCLQCLTDLPKVGLHRLQFSELHQRIVGHAPIDKAAAYFWYYRDSPYAQLIRKAKYNGLPRINRHLASAYASELAADGFFDDIDILMPVPLHPLRELKRGYNQSRYIALGLRDVTGLPIGDNLKALRNPGSQTHLGADRRIDNKKGVYGVKRAADLDGKHILVVDDVMTTGATLLACCEALHAAAPTATISVLTLAVTRLR